MKISNKIGNEIREYSPGVPILLAGLVAAGCMLNETIPMTNVDSENREPKIPQRKIGKYTLHLNPYVPGYNHIYVRDEKENLVMYSFDYNKDTIPDKICLRTANPDSTIRELASVNKLSKIEKELLEEIK